MDKANPRQQQGRHSPPKKCTRTRTGCLNCRRKKRKCDERRPICGTCVRRNQRCEWGLKITFRDENVQALDSSHPSMTRMARRQPRDFEILDVTAEVIRDYDLPTPLTESNDRRDTVGRSTSTPTPLQAQQQLYGAPPSDRSFSGRDTVRSTTNYFETSSFRLRQDDGPPPAIRHSRTAVDNLLYLGQSGAPHSTINDPIQASLGSMPMDVFADYLDKIQAFSPDGPFEDGIFLPGSAYHELHSTLRNHLIQEVQSTTLTRPATPAGPQDGKAINQVPEQDIGNQGVEERPSTVVEPPLLNKEEELILWRNWFDEIAPWLDKFDKERHFQHIIPTIAASHDHLRYSMLALSARQLELKETTRATDRSLTLYQEAIHLLLPHLPTRSTAVIASCVILCVLEMLSCSPKAWRRHLDGCASLMEAMSINGFVGGTEEALFWCFARMDVCGGLISSIKTLIPVSHWASKINLDADVDLFRSRDGFGHWANYAVFLVAQVLDFLAPDLNHPGGTTSRSDPNLPDAWLKLWKHISDWHDLRPAPLHSIMTISSSETSPFPTILFSNPAGMSGNQLYHTASILMLQNKPPDLRLSAKPRSILWHARQICAISISNDHHGAWTNGIQPLWIAGRCMSHPTEHRAILELLARIKRECGWGTRWRAKDLKELWGDLGE